jgi:hypothetical protein
VSEHSNLNDRLIGEIKPLVEAIDERLDLDPYAREIVLAVVTKATFVGVRVGVAEALAQAVEQGLDVTLDLNIVDPTIDELLSDDPGS